jgi:GTPase
VRAEVPMIEVWNKSDLLDPDTRARMHDAALGRAQVLALSALTGEGVEALLDRVSEHLSDIRIPARLELAFDQGRARAWLHDHGVVVAEAQTDSGWAIDVLWTARDESRWRSLSAG